MTRRSENPTRRTRQEINEILQRVDQLPVLDKRPADQILGHDEEEADSGPKVLAKRFFGGKVPKAVKDFLKYRHRDWER